MEPTCSSRDKLIVLWTLNRKVKIFLRIEDFHFRISSQAQLRGTKFLTDVGVIYESIQYQFNPSRPNPDEEKNEGFHKTFWGTTKSVKKKIT